MFIFQIVFLIITKTTKPLREGDRIERGLTNPEPTALSLASRQRRCNSTVYDVMRLNCDTQRFVTDSSREIDTIDLCF